MKPLMPFLVVPMLVLFLLSALFAFPVPEPLFAGACVAAAAAGFALVMGSPLRLGRVTGRETGGVELGSSTMDDLHARLADLAAKAQVIENTADAEKRSMTPEEVAEVKKIQVAFHEVEEEIAAREATASMKDKLNAPQPRITKPVDVVPNPESEDKPRAYGSGVTGGLPSGTTKGSWGFRSMGDFTLAARATALGQRGDPRIMNAPSTFGSEGVSSDGGYAVPPDFRQNIMKTVLGEESLLARCDQQQTSGNSLTLPKDSVSPWDTANGVQVAWMGEGSDFAKSKPSLGKIETKVHKIGALVALTDELVEDAGALTAWLNSKVPEKLTSALNDTIINGDGNGKPLGILQSAATVSVAKEAGQAADTVNANNVAKMYARMYGPCRQRAVWLVHSDVEAQLNVMSIGNQPVYLPPGGLSASPFGMLYGRPVLPMEACDELGDKGDIIFADLSQYLAVLKTGGLKTDTSMHLYFDSGHQAVRFALRIGGQPYWDAPISRKNGSSSLSAFVTLDARA